MIVWNIIFVSQGCMNSKAFGSHWILEFTNWIRKTYLLSAWTLFILLLSVFLLTTFPILFVLKCLSTINKYGNLSNYFGHIPFFSLENQCIFFMIISLFDMIEWNVEFSVGEINGTERVFFIWIVQILCFLRVFFLLANYILDLCHPPPNAPSLSFFKEFVYKKSRLESS